MTSRAATARRLERASGGLVTEATAHMEEQLAWFRQLPAEERSWVGLVAQAGITGVIAWYREHDSAGPGDARPSAALDLFSAAPRDLARAISLEQTVDMVRCTVDLLERRLPEIAGPDAATEVHQAVLAYAREVAFATAEVYARAAEARGAWDARLEALVMEGLLRGELSPDVAGRAATLGWSADGGVTVLVGSPPSGDSAAALAVMRRVASHHDLDLLTGLQGFALVALVGRSAQDELTARQLTPHFGPGPVVIGPHASNATSVAESAAQALFAHAVAPAWAQAPRPVHADELLPERALAGDPVAAARLSAHVIEPLEAADPELTRTLSTFLEVAPSLEGTARALFVHTNTVRHRLRRIETITGRSPTDPRDALALRLALILSRL